MVNQEKGIKIINRFSQLLFLIVIIGGIYIMSNGIGLIDGLDFGPGQYYYTDIPNWEKYFLNEDITFNTKYPILFLALFVGWGVIAWNAWRWLDQKLDKK